MKRRLDEENGDVERGAPGGAGAEELGWLIPGMRKVGAGDGASGAADGAGALAAVGAMAIWAAAILMCPSTPMIRVLTAATSALTAAPLQTAI